MSPSSKFVQRRGRHSTPRVCVPPPPPPLIPIPPPPPTCPPATITGYVEADWGVQHYYAPFSADRAGGPAIWTYEAIGTNGGDHLITITLTGPPGTWQVEVEVNTTLGATIWCNSIETGWTWCTHQDLTIATWAIIDPWDATCMLRMVW